jgi:hypothetical protein
VCVREDLGVFRSVPRKKTLGLEMADHCASICVCDVSNWAVLILIINFLYLESFVPFTFDVLFHHLALLRTIYSMLNSFWAILFINFFTSSNLLACMGVFDIKR